MSSYAEGMFDSKKSRHFIFLVWSVDKLARFPYLRQKPCVPVWFPWNIAAFLNFFYSTVWTKIAHTTSSVSLCFKAIPHLRPTPFIKNGQTETNVLWN